MSSSSRYEALLQIGTGGMASVHVGRLRGAEGFSRLVALKRAHAHLREDAAFTDSMRKEARIASRLHHANVVSVLDVEEEADDLVLVLDYVEGSTLSDLLEKMNEEGEKHPRAILRILVDVAAGLHAAHGACDEQGRVLGLVHRDVSPSNVLVGIDGVARVSDFGIAKALFSDRERTETGVLKGKAAYMAPEYVLHQRANVSTDLFSLGIVAWEALTGTRLFKGASEIETLNRIVNANVKPMADLDPSLAPFDPIVARALERLPEDRWASVDDLGAALANAARERDLLASHLEVGALVERIAQKELEDRRRDLARHALSYVGVVPAPPLSRDHVVTSTITVENDATTLALPIEPPPPLPLPVAPQPLADPISVGGFREEARLEGRNLEKIGLAFAVLLLMLALVGLGRRIASKAPETIAPAAAPPSATVDDAPSALPSSAVFVEEVSSTAPAGEVDGAAPRAPGSRPVQRRTFPAPSPTWIPRKAPPNPYGH